LPPTIGGWWLDAGADTKLIFDVKHNGQVNSGSKEQILAELDDLEKTGLVEYVKRARSRPGFIEALKVLHKWNTWERSWLANGVDRRRLREYAKHYYRRVWFVRERYLMDSALQWILDPEKADFVLTPEEFERCIATLKHERASAADFRDRLALAVREKGLDLPENKWNVKRRLRELEIDRKAPDYIKKSSLGLNEKYALLQWRQDGGDDHDEVKESALRELAQQSGIPTQGKETQYDAVRRLLEEAAERSEREERFREWLDSETEDSLADKVVDEFYADRDEDFRASLRAKLATFDKAELAALRELVHRQQHLEEWVAVLRAMSPDMK
jgi:hypothetical protein